VLSVVVPRLQRQGRHGRRRLDGDRRRGAGRRLVVELHVDQLRDDDDERQHVTNGISFARMSEFQRFRGTDRYLTSPGLEAAVNCALALERPLLVRGEPGTGTTMLAESIAAGLQMKLIHWPV